MPQDNIDKILCNSSNDCSEHKKLEFIGLFKELYKVPLFKIGLDVSLTKAEIGNLKFNIQDTKQKTSLHGCCITKKKTIFNKAFGSFMQSHSHIVEIKTLTADVLMHEIAHSLEFESKINLSTEFANIFQYDLKKINKGHLLIKDAINQILYKDLTLYKKSQYNSEFLARYFELLARSKEVGGFTGQYHFTLIEIINCFPNVTKWIEKIF